MTALFVILTYISMGVGASLLINYLDMKHPGLKLGRIASGGELVGAVLSWPLLCILLLGFVVTDLLDKPIRRINDKMEKDVKR